MQPAIAPKLPFATSTGGTVGGSVPATLSLTLGAPASFGAFTPGVTKDYAATTQRERGLDRGRRGADACPTPAT